MPFRPSFDCLWCGRPWTVSGPDDLEGWANLCPDCLGRAGDNGFLRERLREAIGARGKAHAAVAATPLGDAPVATTPPRDGAEMIAYYEARAGEYDDWYRRRGRYRHGQMDDLAWQADLDEATRWLDARPLAGRIVELAAGTGWWSPLLASKGELWCYDAASAPLDLARERLVAHRLRAHLHVRDAWAEPEPPEADALFLGFWVSHVARDRLVAFLKLVRRWLRAGGQLTFIDSRQDPASGAADTSWDPTTEIATRRLEDGRAFRVPKVYYGQAELIAALETAGFKEAEVVLTPRFFLLGSAVAA